MILGLTTSISAASHGLHAATSRRLGFLWILRLPRGLPLEMLHGVGDVHCPPVNANLLQNGIEQAARRAHEGGALRGLPGLQVARRPT